MHSCGHGVYLVLIVAQQVTVSSKYTPGLGDSMQEGCASPRIDKVVKGTSASTTLHTVG